MPMVNVLRNERAPLPARRELDPFRLVRGLLHWGPLAEIVPILRGRRVGFVPSCDVRETDDSHVITADVPGVADEHLDLSLAGDRLVVSGRREVEAAPEESWLSRERAAGSFTRSFTLPDGADADRASAELRDGVLTIVLPKRPDLQPRRIEVRWEGRKLKA